MMEIRGLNNPNKQEDVKNFLIKNKVGIFRLLEPKIKVVNMHIAANVMLATW